MSATALKKLVESSKATVLVAVVVLLGVLVYVGRLDVAQFESTLKWLVGVWFVAHAGEQGARALADGKTAAALVDKQARDESLRIGMGDAAPENETKDSEAETK